MTATSYFFGHKVKFEDGLWIYMDSKTLDNPRPCPRCGELPTPEGYDPCVGFVYGAKSICCGHGVKRPILIEEN